MGNYFSISASETKESIKIINEIDHVQVIASGSQIKDEHIINLNHGNEIASNDFLNEETQRETESNVDVPEKEKKNEIQPAAALPDCIVYKKTNMKKKKCKKNKKHLQ
jgi:hypothetical protein